MADIIFPPSTAPGNAPAESGGRLINAYGEQLVGAPSTQYVLRRTSGLRLFSSTGQTVYRSSFFDGTNLFTAWSGQLVKTTAGGVSNIVTALGGTDWVTWAKNLRTPPAVPPSINSPDMVVVSSQAGPFIFDAGGKAPWPCPAAPNSVAWGEGYFFITIPDGRVYASGINSLGFNILDRIQAQAKANDGLVRCVWFGSELVIFSNKHAEFWGSQGNPNLTGFPLRRSEVVPVGLASASCVTGWENDFGGQLCFLASDNTIRAFNGYIPEVINDPWLTTVLEGVTDKSTLSMGCFVKRGHQCIYIRGPGFCACYDFATQWWHERASFLSPTWRWMGGSSSAWNEWLSGDTMAPGGQICAIDFNQYQECGDPLVWQVESGPVDNFPSRFAVARACFRFQQGTGLLDAGGALQADVDPKLEISWSDDDAASWAHPLQRSIGKIGQFKNMIDPRMLGMTGYVGRRWRLRCGSRVYVALMGGGAFMEERA